MDNRIENQINKTLECMGRDGDIEVSPLFTEKLSDRLAAMRVSRSIGYRNRTFYPVAIVLLIVLNLAITLASFKVKQSASSVSTSQTNVLASEYGIGQSKNMTF